MQTYEENFEFTLGAAGFFAADWQNNSSLRKIIGLHAAGTQFTMNIYNRAFTYAAKTLVGVQKDPAGTTCLLSFLPPAQHNLRVGDSVTVAATTTYDGTHVVTKVLNDFQVVTATAHTVDVVGGTAALAIPSAQWPLFKVIPETQSSSGGVLELFQPPGYAVANRDPGTQRHTHKLYIHCSVAGTYRVSLGGTADLF
jgi:hypothetical protein